MEKNELIQLAEQFYQQAFSANSYFLIHQQYKENHKNNFSEIQISSAFYSITHNAIIEALIITLAKIYDKNQSSMNIRQLLEECKSNMTFFPERTEIISIDGQEHILEVIGQHTVKQGEEWYFTKEIESNNQISSALGIKNAPVIVEMKKDEYFNFYVKKFSSLNAKMENLRIQRNKVYAHNDKDSILDIDAVIEQNPLDLDDIQMLIEYALEVSKFIIASLTGVLRADKYVNINDWKNTLMLVQIGEKYKEYEIKERMQSQVKQ